MPARLASLLLLLVCTSAALRAQSRFDERSISLTLGIGAHEFAYAADDTSFAYAFDATFPVLMISGEESFFSLGIGTQKADAATGRPALTLVEAVMEGGSHVYLFRSLGGGPVGAFLPLRTTLELRYAGLSDRSESEGATVDDLALVAGSLGAGLGGALRPADRRRPVLIGSWLSSLGVLSDLAAFPHTDARLLRTTDVHAALKFERLLGPRLGLTVGYSYRSLRWGDRSPEDPQDVTEALLRPRTLPRRNSHHLFRAGINW